MKKPPKGSFNPRRYKDPERLLDKIEKQVAAGVGQGTGIEYEPWLKIGSFSSRGVSLEVPSLVNSRTHHYLSKGEYYFHLLQEYSPSVVEIREQFPLIKYHRTFQIALEKAYKPSFYPGTNVPRVYTTDFMLTKINLSGERYLSAVSVKYRRDYARLAKTKKGLKRAMELAEIERCYWAELGIEWDTVFVEDFPMTRVRNIIALRTHAVIKGSLATERAIAGMIEYLLKLTIPVANEISLKALIRGASRFLYMTYVDAFHLFMYMVWHKYIDANLDEEIIRITKSFKIVGVNSLPNEQCISGVA